MFVVDPFQSLQEVGFRMFGSLGGDDYVLPVSGHLQRGVHAYFEDIQECLVDDKGRTVAVPDQFLCHRLNVSTTCIHVKVWSCPPPGYRALFGSVHIGHQPVVQPNRWHNIEFGCPADHAQPPPFVRLAASLRPATLGDSSNDLLAPGFSR